MGDRQYASEDATCVGVGERAGARLGLPSMISQDEFVRRYNEAHRRLTGSAASPRVAVRHYGYFVDMRKLVKSEEAVPIFEPIGREKAIDKRGNISWHLRPVRSVAEPA